MLDNIKYWDDDPNNGIIYDWGLIQKEYKKLKCPKHVYQPVLSDFSKVAYQIIMSDRSNGKTTNPLLCAMIMYKLYGTVCHVVRQTKYICEPKMIQDLYKTVLEFDYISKIFDGQYNSIRYRGKRWRLTYLDDDGNVLEESPPVCVCLGLDEWQDLKSAYNAPRGDIVIFDEFINEQYGFNDFVHFLDILKTIFRDRRGYVFMLANTIDINSQWFDEFCIRKDIEDMKAGEKRYIKTDLDTAISIEILSPVRTKQRRFINSWLFGFPNKKLAAITGGETWAMANYQHIPPEKETPVRSIYSKVHVYHAGKFVKLRLVYNDQVGYCVYVHPVKYTYDDSTILTAGNITDSRYQFGFGNKDSKILTLIWRLYAGNRFFYSRNSEGALIHSYIKAVNLKKREMLI